MKDIQGLTQSCPDQFVRPLSIVAVAERREVPHRVQLQHFRPGFDFCLWVSHRAKATPDLSLVRFPGGHLHWEMGERLNKVMY